jgi:HAD superfamily hydrolase (TIGR01509 family)
MPWPDARRVPDARIDTLFVDKGGVLVDNNSLAPQWRRLIGEYLAPRLGRTPRAWGEANRSAFERQLGRWRQVMRAPGPADIRGFFARDAVLWLIDMCDVVEVPRPPPEDAERIARATVAYVEAHLDIPSPGRVIDALRALRSRGVTLHIASADAHEQLVAFLRHIGARQLFDRVYGSDLINTWKSGPAYYRAVLADTGTAAERAAVVDDSAEAIAWASECGMRGFHVDHTAGDDFETAVTRTLDAVARALD